MRAFFVSSKGGAYLKETAMHASNIQIYYIYAKFTFVPQADRPLLDYEQIISYQHINIAREEVFDNLAILRSFPLQTTPS